MSEISGISEEVPQGTEATTETTADIAKKLQDRVAAIYPWQQLFKDRKVVQTSGGEAVAKITAKLESHGLLRRIAFGSKANVQVEFGINPAKLEGDDLFQNIGPDDLTSVSIIEHGPKGEIKAQGSVYTTNGSERYIASHISHGQFLEMENDKATESELDRLIRTANTAFHPTVSSKK